MKWSVGTKIGAGYALALLHNGKLDAARGQELLDALIARPATPWRY